jgi:hypothetical protein
MTKKHMRDLIPKYKFYVKQLRYDMTVVTSDIAKEALAKEVARLMVLINDYEEETK